MREVADLAGVAISSVSRVLSGHPDVSPDMKARVLSAVEHLGYEPDFLAQSLRRGDTSSIGFVMADITNPVIALAVRGAEAYLRRMGYSLLLMSSDGDPALDAAHVGLLQSRRVDGMLLSLVAETDEQTLDTLRRAVVPVVAMDRSLPNDLGASAVMSDHAAGMQAAIGHLAALGHRRIALVNGLPDTHPARERAAAFAAAVGALGPEARSWVIPGQFTREHGLSATRALLESPEAPTAIVSGGNQLLVGTLQAISEADLEVGRDVSVIGCDGSHLETLFRPRVSSISRDMEEIGAVGAELLLRRLGDDPSPPETVILPTIYTPRASCGAALS